MNTFKDHLAILTRLARTAATLAETGTPIDAFHHPLTPDEMTVRALAIGGGLVPAFEDGAEVASVLKRIGKVDTWDQLVDALTMFGGKQVYDSGLVDIYVVENPHDGSGYLAHGDVMHFEDLQPILHFGPEGVKKALRSLDGYEVNKDLQQAVRAFEFHWAAGEMTAATQHKILWHEDVFDVQLWRNTSSQQAWDQAVAALIKLAMLSNDLPEAMHDRVLDALQLIKRINP